VVAPLGRGGDGPGGSVAGSAFGLVPDVVASNCLVLRVEACTYSSLLLEPVITGVSCWPYVNCQSRHGRFSVASLDDIVRSRLERVVPAACSSSKTTDNSVRITAAAGPRSQLEIPPRQTT
jgi:hypothetical protein